MSGSLVWMHEDALRLDHPVFDGTEGAADAVFIWDDEHLEAMGYSFQRLVFIYETLCELGVAIYRGPTHDMLIRLADSRGKTTIRVADSPNPALRALRELLAQHLAVHCIEEPAFVTPERDPDLRRFFRYWKRVRRPLLRE